MKLIYLILVIVFTGLISCKPGNSKKEDLWSELPELIKLEELKTTEFVPTLENPIHTGKNIVYAPSFLFAWDKIRREIKGRIVLSDTNSTDFKLLNGSASFVNSLDDTEYTTDVSIDGDIIVASAFFNITLPFPAEFQKLNTPVLFDSTKVSAFGMEYFDEELIKYVQILYYGNEDNFMLRLIPKDSLHEIDLVKGMRDAISLSGLTRISDSLVKIGAAKKRIPANSWQYLLNPGDILSIPVIKFNVGTNYKALEGQRFNVNGRYYSLEMAYQRTGFILNEKGAVIESEASAVLDSSIEEPVRVHPRKMIFDKPFVIIARKSGNKNPYFVMRIENAELLIRE